MFYFPCPESGNASNNWHTFGVIAAAAALMLTATTTTYLFYQNRQLSRDVKELSRDFTEWKTKTAENKAEFETNLHLCVERINTLTAKIDRLERRTERNTIAIGKGTLYFALAQNLLQKKIRTRSNSF